MLLQYPLFILLISQLQLGHRLQIIIKDFGWVFQ
jgi:hypothetical protein